MVPNKPATYRTPLKVILTLSNGFWCPLNISNSNDRIIIIVKEDKRMTALEFGNCIYIKHVINAIIIPKNLLGRDPELAFKS